MAGKWMQRIFGIIIIGIGVIMAIRFEGLNSGKYPFKVQLYN
jgi:hypothetical protein